MSKNLNIYIKAGDVASFTTDSLTSGTYVRLPNPGGAKNTPTAFSASSTVTIGPFNNPYDYLINYEGTDISVSQSASGVVTSSDDTTINNLVAGKNTVNLGTAGTGFSAVEYGDAYQHTTVLTANTALGAIAGGAALGVGKLAYTLPDGACIVNSAYINLAIQQTEDNITADTPAIGLGTTIAAGAIANFSGDATMENVLTEQTAADCDGTATVKTVADQVLVIESASNHTIYVNVADTWAASGDAGAGLTGIIVLNWQFVE